jgi:hypothetical protein
MDLLGDADARAKSISIAVVHATYLFLHNFFAIFRHDQPRFENGSGGRNNGTISYHFESKTDPLSNLVRSLVMPSLVVILS